MPDSAGVRDTVESSGSAVVAEHSARNNGAASLAPNDDRVRRIPMRVLRPSPLNPRKHFEQAAIDELADSLHRHGLMQPLTVRAVERGDYEIVAGERRYRAAQQLGWTEISCIVRACTEEEALELALVENLIRRDIDPIEEAQGYRQLADMGLKQAEIALRVRRAQPTIANRMRLLELPEDVRQRISAGELTPAHGITILRFAGFPTIMSEIARLAVEAGVASKTLEKESLPFSHQLSGAKVIRCLNNVQFRAVCGACPHQAFRAKVGGWADWCLKPEHFEELEAQERADAARAAAEALERARAAAAALPDSAKREKIEKAIATAGPPTSPEDDPEDGPETAPAAPSLMRCQDLGHDRYVNLSYRTVPKGCSEDCACRCKALDWQGRAVPICLDPGRFHGLQAAETKAQKAELRTQFDQLLADVEAAAPKTHADPFARRVVVLLARTVLYSVPVDILREVAKKQPDGDVRAFLDKPGHATGDWEAWTLLESLPLAELAAIVGEVIVRNEIRQALEVKRKAIDEADFLLDRAPTSDGDTDAPEDTEERARCLRCGDMVPADVDAWFPEATAAGMADVVARHESGAITTANAALYCAECAPDVAICRVCGCTDEAGCDEGCSWIEPDLCSACSDSAASAEPNMPEPPFPLGARLQHKRTRSIYVFDGASPDTPGCWRLHYEGNHDRIASGTAEELLDAFDLAPPIVRCKSCGVGLANRAGLCSACDPEEPETEAVQKSGVIAAAVQLGVLTPGMRIRSKRYPELVCVINGPSVDEYWPLRKEATGEAFGLHESEILTGFEIVAEGAA